jgi:hypothetical protein
MGLAGRGIITIDKSKKTAQTLPKTAAEDSTKALDSFFVGKDVVCLAVLLVFDEACEAILVHVICKHGMPPAWFQVSYVYIFGVLAGVVAFFYAVYCLCPPIFLILFLSYY